MNDTTATVVTLRADLAAAQEREAALGAVLAAINANPGDPTPVFETILEKAHSVCGASMGNLWLYDGALIHAAATRGMAPGDVARLRQPRRPTVVQERMIRERVRTFQRVDQGTGLADVDPASLGSSAVRTVMAVALMQDDTVIGIISAQREEARAFSDQEIGLLQAFADQAVLAIGNARLLGDLRQSTADLRQSLEYQTAISDVLKVISRSTFDLTLVLETLLAAAARLCDADSGGIATVEGDSVRVATHYGHTGSYYSPTRGQLLPLSRVTVHGRTVLGGRIVHVADIAADPSFVSPDASRPAPQGTMLGVPLLRDGAVLGSIRLARDVVHPFTERQIALVSTFADQAVIAMENARLLSEQREALARQTAMADILAAINAHPGNPQPAFGILLERALSLCDAAFGILISLEGEVFNTVASLGVPPAYAEFRAAHPQPAQSSGPMAARIAAGQTVVHVLDAMDDVYHDGEIHRRALVDLGGGRTILLVALTKDSRPIGAIQVYRTEVRAFRDPEIALLEAFAAQAVIAMENARLLSEQQEALERQTATAEVLEVINASPGNLAPVFDSMLEKAMRLCGIDFGLLRAYDGASLHNLATRGLPPDYAAFAAGRTQTPMPGGAVAQALASARPAQLLDLRDFRGYLDGDPAIRAAADLGGARTFLSVPLVKDGASVGLFSVYRQEVRAFTDREIAVLEGFAAQAVIAMDNARLLTEQQEALERETATADILKVINTARGDLRPVFDAILEKAHLLCGANIGSLMRYDGAQFHAATTRGFPPSAEAVLRQPIPPTVRHRELMDGGRFVHVSNLADDPSTGSGVTQALLADTDVRTLLLVPLRQDDAFLGFISAFRDGVRPFAEREIALLESFAAQAAIAIENARLLTEQQEALARQTAVAEVLATINANPGTLAPVFDSLLQRALRLCGAAFGILRTFDGAVFNTAASLGVPPAYAAFLDANPQRPVPGSMGARIAAGELVVHVLDASDDDLYRDGEAHRRALVDLGGARTTLIVALVKDARPVGVIQVYRTEVRGFGDAEIALLSAFAAQAVIAMENARLLTEQREALERQTAAAEVLAVINANPGNLVPVFDAMLERAMRLCGAAFGELLMADGKSITMAAMRGMPEAYMAYRTATPPSWNDLRPSARVLTSGRSVNVADMTEEDAYKAGDASYRAIVEIGGVRANINVPLLRDGIAIGFFAIYRSEPGAFPDKQIALLENFAAQAVIAMENARLLTAQREALERQTAMAEVLAIINAHPGELAPVFDAMLERAMRLCGIDFGLLRSYDGVAMRMLSSRGVPAPFAVFLESAVFQRPRPQSAMGVALASGRPSQILDLREYLLHGDFGAADQPFVANVRAMVDLGGARTVLYVPLVKDGASIGFFTFFRQEVRSFSDKEIALLDNFAAQGVIAMENARLLTETREALEQQTATAEILRVINASPGDLQPVFETILDQAMRLCGAAFGTVGTWDGEYLHNAAWRGYPAEYAAFLAARGPTRNASPALLHMAETRRPVHLADAREGEAYRSGHPVSRAITDLGGARTILGVPMLKDETMIGFITVYRQEVRPFADKEIALLERFAAQAVIAMENARLLNELRDALERQTATAEVLGVINANPGNLAPVFDAILQASHRLCGFAQGTLLLCDGDSHHAVATHGYPPAADAHARQPRPVPPFMRAMATTRTAYHTADLTQSNEEAWNNEFGRRFIATSGARSYLMVPLLNDTGLVGFISAFRTEVRPFTAPQIALVEAFAAQAVIAMENARLLGDLRARTDELAQRQEELRVTFENMNDGVALFDEHHHLLAWNANFLHILDLPEDTLAPGMAFADYIRTLAARGEYGDGADVEEQVARVLALAGQRRSFERGRPGGRTVEIRNNPVADGGFVLIYADITERKRAEAEIAAARDAAEQAARTIEAAYRDLKTAQANLVQAEKMASLGALTAGIAHEIKNPLNFVNNFAGLSVELLDELKEVAAPGFAHLDADARADIDDLSATLTANLGKIVQHGRRADGIVRSMLEHSRGTSGERRSVDLNELVEEALNLAYHGARAQDPGFNITLERDYAPAIAPIALAPQDITRVLLNLIGNGFHAARKRAEAAPGVEPLLTVATRDRGNAVEIRVRDNGTGIPPDIRDRIFEPFFTTKPTGEGTGLGLSITYDIVTKQHGGAITVDSAPGSYTEFTVTLPRDGGAR